MADHLVWPCQLDPTGRLAVVDRDSLTGTAQAVRLTLTTEPGERVVTPAFGILDPTFSGIDETDVREAVARWVPRAVIDITSEPAGADGTQQARVTVTGVR